MKLQLAIFSQAVQVAHQQVATPDPEKKFIF